MFCFPSEPCSGKALPLLYVLWGPYSDSILVNNAHSSGLHLFPSNSAGVLAGLTLYGSCVGSHSHCDFTSALVSLRSEDAVFLQPPQPAALNSSHSTSPWSFSFEGSGGAIWMSQMGPSLMETLVLCTLTSCEHFLKVQQLLEIDLSNLRHTFV